MKLKVLVIMINLAGNKVAKAGDVIDKSQLPVPGNVDKLIEDGYVEALDIEDEDEDLNPELTAELAKVNAMKKSELVAYAEENEYAITEDANKPVILAEIVEAIEDEYELEEDEED